MILNLARFAFAQPSGVTGFTTTLLQLEQQYFLLAHGYVEAGQLITAIDKVLEEKKI